MAKFDVVKQYDWTNIPRDSCLRKQAPRVWVKSYKFESNQALNRLKSYMNIVNTGADEFYDKLYGDATSPEDDFNFPYFNDNLRSFSNTFGDTFQNGFGGGGGIGEALDAMAQTGAGLGAQLGTAIGSDALDEASAIVSSKNLSNTEKVGGALKAIGSGLKNGGDPGSYIETPKMYQYEQNDAPLDVSFVLSNTINSDYTKNNELIKHLTRICRPFRKNSIAMDPPRIFQVKIPGQRFIKWASCSNFSINMLGTKREIGGVVTPEAYQITMSFTSLTVEAANFMDRV